MIIWMNVHVVLNKTVVNRDNLCGSHLQSQSEMYLWLLVVALMKKMITWWVVQKIRVSVTRLSVRSLNHRLDSADFNTKSVYVIGHCCRGRDECISCPEGGCWYYFRVTFCPSAAILADTYFDLSWEKFHNHLPSSCGLPEQVSARPKMTRWPKKNGSAQLFCVTSTNWSQCSVKRFYWIFVASLSLNFWAHCLQELSI